MGTRRRDDDAGDDGGASDDGGGDETRAGDDGHEDDGTGDDDDDDGHDEVGRADEDDGVDHDASARAPSTWRAVAAAAALLAAAVVLVWQVRQHRPLGEWMFFRYAGYWLAAAAFTLGCVGAGARALALLDARYTSVREELFDSFALGVLFAFFTLSVAGLAGLLGRPLFFALPLALTLLGGRPLVRLARKVARLARHVARPTRPAPLGTQLTRLGAALVLIVGLALVYAGVALPHNATFDARWYHLGLAEEYVVRGAIQRSSEGWYMAAYPHLASILYTWGLLSPGQLFDRVEVAAHLELVIFLFTLLGAGNLARRLVPGAAYAGTLMMLFPGVYLYDSALGLGADHVSALWAPMVGVGALRLRHDRSVAAWSIAALGACGAVLTKYTAVTLALGPGLALGALAALLVARVLTKREPASVLRGPLVALGLALLVTSPHWLKNALWYHNPVYPFMGKTFPSAPWSADAQARFEHMRFLAWAPTGTTGEKLRETLGAMFSFSFVPHDWPKFHGKVPVFGSLFTLGLVALPFLRRTARTWLLVGATYLGLFFWYWTQHEDRYLQTLVPWMAATVAATFTLAWRAHWAPRLGVLTLVGTQAVWGGDVPFIPARSMLGKPPIEAFSELLSQGYLRKHPQRLQVFEQYRALGALVPADAVLLVHDHNQRLGIGRRVVMDGPLFQGGLVYGREPSVAAAVQTLRRVGVTHVAWSPRTSRGQDSLASDLVFFDLAEHATVEPRRSGSFRVATLGDVAPEPRQPDKALFLGCPKSGYAQGLYPRVALSAPSGAKPETYVFPVPEKKVGKGISLEPLVAEARYVVRDPKCTKHVPGLDQFVLLAKREKTVELYGRPRGEAAERERGEEPPVAPEDTLD